MPLPVENVLDEWVCRLHVDILVGTSLPKDFVKVKHMLEKEKGCLCKGHSFHPPEAEYINYCSWGGGTSHDK